MFKHNLFIVSFLAASIISHATTSHAEPRVATNAESVMPVDVGANVPSANIRTADGKAIDFSTYIKDKPTVLIFYRGSWCPYCNTHLGQLSTIESALSTLGFQIVAVSPDRPEKIRELVEGKNLNYTLISDSKSDLTKAFGLAFKVDDQTFKKYIEKYQIDIEAASGEKHHILPVPAAFVIDSSGIIRYRYFNANYKERINSNDLLEAAKKVIP